MVSLKMVNKKINPDNLLDCGGPVDPYGVYPPRREKKKQILVIHELANARRQDTDDAVEEKECCW